MFALRAELDVRRESELYRIHHTSSSTLREVCGFWWLGVRVCHIVRWGT